MADIETTLKTRTNQDNVFPNIHSANIPDGGVTTAKIADHAVTGLKIANQSITNAKLADSGVTTPKIADSNVTTPKLADGAVTRDKIALGAIGYNQIEDGAIFGDKIPDESISGSKLAEDSIDTGCFSTTRISIYDLIETYGSTDFLDYYAPSLVHEQCMRLVAEWDTGSYMVYVNVDYIYVLQGQYMSIRYHDPIDNADVTIDYPRNAPTPTSLKRVYAYYIAGAF